MRLRNKPWAVDLVKEHPELVLQDPNPAQKINWRQRFGNGKKLEVEVGSGKGRFITTLAAKNPDKNYVALERQTTAAGMILRTVLEDNLHNVQIIRGDASNIDSFFMPHSVGAIYLNFSDPWPKRRHEKRRLTYKAFLAKYQQVLEKHGQISFKTDNAGLFAYSLKSMNNFGMKFAFVSLDLHHEDAEILKENVETEYEQKFAARGNPIFALQANFK